MVKKFPVCEKCKNPRPKKDTCCQMLFEAKYPLQIDYLKPYMKWTRLFERRKKK